MQSLLPTEKDVEKFIDEIEEFDDEEFTFQETLLAIKACFQKQLQQLVLTANLTNRNLLKMFETLKLCLLETSQNQKLKAKHLHERLDTLTEKVDKLAKKLVADSEAVAEIAKDMQKQQETLKHTVRDFQHFLEADLK